MTRKATRRPQPQGGNDSETATRSAPIQTKANTWAMTPPRKATGPGAERIVAGVHHVHSRPLALMGAYRTAQLSSVLPQDVAMHAPNQAPIGP
jgi:hypothetical protein